MGKKSPTDQHGVFVTTATWSARYLLQQQQKHRNEEVMWDEACSLCVRSRTELVWTLCNSSWRMPGRCTSVMDSPSSPCKTTTASPTSSWFVRSAVARLMLFFWMVIDHSVCSVIWKSSGKWTEYILIGAGQGEGVLIKGGPKQRHELA